MHNHYVDLTDRHASDAFHHAERSADLLQALHRIYATRGIEAIAIIALRYGMEYNPSTIANILDVSTRRVEQVLRQTLRSLKETLEA